MFDSEKNQENYTIGDKYYIKPGVNILQKSPINIGEKFPQNVGDEGRVCQLEGICFMSRIVLGKSFCISSGKSY